MFALKKVPALTYAAFLSATRMAGCIECLIFLGVSHSHKLALRRQKPALRTSSDTKHRFGTITNGMMVFDRAQEGVRL